MSRLKDALMTLLGKCTPEGTHPVGNNTDEIIECLSAHFVGVKFAEVKQTSGGYSLSGISFEGIKEAIADGMDIVLKTGEGNFTLSSSGESYVTFSNSVIGNDEIHVRQYEITNTGSIAYRTRTLPCESSFLVTVTKTDGVYKADKTFAEIKAAADARKVVRCLCDGSYYDIVSATSNVVRFSRVLHRVSDDGTTIAETSLVAVEINPADGVLVVGRALEIV